MNEIDRLTRRSERSGVSPFVVMDVMQAAAERAATGAEVLHLEVGQPSTPAPPPVIERARRALLEDKLGYTVALGIPELRNRIADHYKRFYGVDISPSRVVITPGSSGAFILAILSCFDRGARVAVPSPGYPCYRNILKALDIEPVLVPVASNTNYLITQRDLEALSAPVDGVLVSSPSNPTGTMYSTAQLSELVGYCETKGIQFISDEIYHGISFESRAETALQHSDSPFVVNSFSKYFSMTGWRIGWMIVPPEFLRTIERLIQNLFIATSTLSQIAATEAFSCYDLLNQHVMQYKKNRDTLLSGLQSAGLDKLSSPEGAFYIYADVGRLTQDSIEFCKRILAETGVAITPGVDFDPAAGHRTIRFSYAADHATIERATERLADWFLRQ